MATFQKCEDADHGAEIEKVAEDLVNKHYPDLLEAEVSIGFTFVFASRDEKTGEPKGPAIKQNGIQSYFSIKVNSLEHRVSGLPDVTAKLDGDRWPELDDDKRKAIIDGILMSIEVKREKEGPVLSDDIGRPKLKRRRPDFAIVGFDKVVERHGYNAPEAQAFSTVHKRWHQGQLNWG